MKRLAEYFTILLLHVGLAFAQQGTSVTVKKVIDGDTLITNENEIINLYCVDAPELEQTFGDTAREYLALQTVDKQVTLYRTGIDGNRNTVAVLVHGDRNINLEMATMGKGFVDTQNCADPAFPKAEEEARGLRRGVWMAAPGTPDNQYPWEFRSRTRQVSVSVPVAQLPIPAPEVKQATESLGTSSPTAPSSISSQTSSGSASSTARGSNSGSHVIHTGPRGGRYYISPSGKKVYIKKK